jgi:hypothetical protein
VISGFSISSHVVFFLPLIFQGCSKEGIRDFGSGMGIEGSWMMVEAFSYQTSRGLKLEGAEGRFNYEDPIYIEFKNNGQVLTLDAGGRTLSSGTYNFDPAARKIQLENGTEAATFDIVNLSPKELKLGITYGSDSEETFNEIVFERFKGFRGR